MGSAGLEWDSNDQPEQARLNQKTRFVGTGAQINALSTTYAGQEAFCTTTGSGFTADVLYTRNAANSAWLSNSHVLSDNITEGSEASSTPITDDGDLTITAGHRYYAFVTMPTDEPLYLVTGIEWKNGGTVAGNVMCGVDIVDADPPTINSALLVATGAEIAQSGTSAVQRNSDIASWPIRGGTVVGVWAQFDNATATIREDNGAANGYKKATSYDNTPSANEVTAWTSGIDPAYMKLYYKGYY